MNRRSFLQVVSLSFLSPALLRSNGVAAEIETRMSERFTKTVDTLARITPERRRTLSENPDELSPVQLHELVPEITEIEVDNSLSDPPSGKELRVLTWNMERGRHWKEGIQLIQEHPPLAHPDVIFLGEMDHGMARSGNVHTTRKLAEGLRMNYAYAVEFLELTRGEEGEREKYPGQNEWGYHGNALLSRYPLRSVRMVRFPGIEKWYTHYQKRLGGRNAIFAEIDVSGTSVTLCSTHFESGFEAYDRESRHREAKLIIGEIDQHAGHQPVIIGGDFNARLGEAAAGVLRAAGFAIEGANDLDDYTVQREHEGEVIRWGAYIDYIAPRGVEIIRSETSPSVQLAAYPPNPSGKMLGDHAIVTLKVRVP